jgi:large subunit ribosomal protein L19
MDIVKQLEQKYMKEHLPEFAVGDTVEVHLKLKEGDKERVQAFVGTVISRKGSGTREMFTVRRIVQGEGVERTFPIHSPGIVDVVVSRRGKVRRAKLYYLREKVGKMTKVKELIVAGDALEKPSASPKKAEKPAAAPKAQKEKKETGGKTGEKK